MRRRSDDPRLTSYLLGELSPEEMREVERWVEGDPALRLVLDEQRQVMGHLERAFGTGKAALRAGQRESVLRAGREADELGEQPALREPKKKDFWGPVGTMAAAAAVVLAGLGVASKWMKPGRVDPVVEKEKRETEIALLPLPGAVWEKGQGETTRAGGSAPTLVEERDRRLRDDPAGFLEGVAERVERGAAVPEHLPSTAASEARWHEGEIRLPVFLGMNSLSWVRSSLFREGKLPRKDAVRLEEWIGAFPLGEGTATQAAGGIKVWAVGAPCAWDPERELVALQIQGPASKAVPVEWSYVTGGEEVRILSSSTAGVKPSSRAIGVLPAGRRTLVVMQVKAAAPVERKLRLVAGGEAAEYPVARGEEKALDVVQVAAAMGLWMRGEGVSRAQVEELAGRLEGRSDPAAKEVRSFVGKAMEVSAARR